MNAESAPEKPEKKDSPDPGPTPETGSGAPSASYDNLPNRLTALRIAFVPVVVLLLTEDSPWKGFVAAIVFGLAAATDYFDGYYARTRKLVTVLGKLLDPLADKFLVVSCLTMLMHLGRIHPFVVILLVCREFAITGLRSIAAAEGIVIAASRLAKWKTVAQMIAIPMLMLHEDYFRVPLQLLGTVFIYLSLLISLWSGRDYVVDFFKTMRAQSKEKRSEKRARRFAKRARRLQELIAQDPKLAEAIRKAAENKA